MYTRNEMYRHLLQVLHKIHGRAEYALGLGVGAGGRLFACRREVTLGAASIKCRQRRPRIGIVDDNPAPTLHIRARWCLNS